MHGRLARPEALVRHAEAEQLGVGPLPEERRVESTSVAGGIGTLTGARR